MAYFRNDYSEVGHPKVLSYLAEIASERLTGYGQDQYSALAEKYLQELLDAAEAKVYFLAGGTVTNVTFLSAVLRPHEAVISVDSGHINVHETGALEASGHKILTTKGQDGKLLVDEIRSIVESNVGPHMVKPKMVYLSNSSEVGTIYKKEELKAIYDTCQALSLYLFVDGARLASALASEENDLSIQEVCQYSDAFFIGGTKIGSPLGEALVISNPELQVEFPWLIKNRTAMLAKTFVPAACFLRLFAKEEENVLAESFEESLMFSLAKAANKSAKILAEKMQAKGISLAYPLESNQIFVYIDKDLRERLVDADVVFENEFADLCRFVTSYSTTEEEIQTVVDLL